MPTEQQLVESLRALATDDTDAHGIEIAVGGEVLRAVRSRRRRRTVMGTAGAVAAISLVGSGGVYLADRQAAPSTSSSHPATGPTTTTTGGGTTLPASILDLRGEAVGVALGLARVPNGSNDCVGLIAGYAPGQSFCVDLGNAPDDWLVRELIQGSQRTSGPLRSVGVPWESDLPAPPPVVIELVRAKLIELGAEFGRQSPQYARARVNLEFARALWDDKKQWEAAGWNDHYWGDPWWPTNG